MNDDPSTQIRDSVSINVRNKIQSFTESVAAIGRLEDSSPRMSQVISLLYRQVVSVIGWGIEPMITREIHIGVLDISKI